MNTDSLTSSTRLAFIGGGNMASAIIGGLTGKGLPAAHITVVEPFEPARQRLQQALGVQAHAHTGEHLRGHDVIVWAVKPQSFADAAAQVAPWAGDALQLSVMAGIRSQALAAATGSGRIVRCMPNTPALIGRGMTGLFAATPHAADRALAEAIIRTTGDALWVPREELLDAITALSGSGPAYVFYFLEAMEKAGVAMGLNAAQARQLACATFEGSAQLAAASQEPLEVLRERVTSKGGTTFAALQVMQAAALDASFITAMQAARQRAEELGRATE